MDVRIGMSNSAREITFETDLSPEEVMKSLSSASDKGEQFASFTNAKGTQWYVNVANIVFVEFGSEAGRRVGFVS